MAIDESLFPDRGRWCEVPGCSGKATRHHHVLYPCDGADDDGGENIVWVCARHLITLRRGWVRVRGRAPDRLTWELGVGEDGKALHVFEPRPR